MCLALNLVIHQLEAQWDVSLKEQFRGPIECKTRCTSMSTKLGPMHITLKLAGNKKTVSQQLGHCLYGKSISGQDDLHMNQ